MSLRAAASALAGCAHELQKRAPELAERLALPPFLELKGAPEKVGEPREKAWRAHDQSDAREIGAVLFLHPRDWGADEGGDVVLFAARIFL